MVWLPDGQARARVGRSLEQWLSSIVGHSNLMWKPNGLTKMKTEVSDYPRIGKQGPPSLGPPPTQDNTDLRPSGIAQCGVRESGGFQGVFTDHEVVLAVGRE